jgi:hypothetical protein
VTKTSGHGSSKRAVLDSNYSFVYTDNKPFIDEKKYQDVYDLQPIKVIPLSPRHKLDSPSQIDYSHPYRIDYGVKVCFIGYLDAGAGRQLVTNWSWVHTHTTSPAGYTFSKQERSLYTSHSVAGSHPASPPYDAQSVFPEWQRYLPQSSSMSEPPLPRIESSLGQSHNHPRCTSPPQTSTNTGKAQSNQPAYIEIRIPDDLQREYEYDTRHPGDGLNANPRSKYRRHQLCFLNQGKSNIKGTLPLRFWYSEQADEHYIAERVLDRTTSPPGKDENGKILVHWVKRGNEKDLDLSFKFSVWPDNEAQADIVVSTKLPDSEAIAAIVFSDEMTGVRGESLEQVGQPTEEATFRQDRVALSKGSDLSYDTNNFIPSLRSSSTSPSSTLSRSSSLYSLQSLISTLEYQSSVSSLTSAPHYGDQLLAFLSKDLQLQDLFEEATQKVSMDRFEKNFRRCLQQFSEHLQIEATSPLFLRASKVVRQFSTNTAHSIRRTLEETRGRSSERCYTDGIRPTEGSLTVIEIGQDSDSDSSDEENPDVDIREEEYGDEPVPELEVALLGSKAFQMLRDNLRLFLRPEPVERAVFETWPIQHSRAELQFFVHEADWEIPKFLELNFDKHPLGKILTLTGHDENAQAVSCEEYLRETWPETGLLLLEAVEKFLLVGDQGRLTFHGSNSARLFLTSYHLVNVSNASGRIQIRAPEFVEEPGKPRIFINVVADYISQVQIGKSISWLCAAFRPSTHESVRRSSVRVMTDQTLRKCKGSRLYPYPDSKSRTIKYTLRDLEAISPSKSCWHALFPHGILAFGFPIRNRNEGIGLEISFADMAVASRSLSFIELNDGLIAHGLTSVLIPMKNLLKEDGVQWHFEDKTKQGLGRLARLSQIINLPRFEDWYKELCPERLVARRCFLGLAKISSVVIGTKGYQIDFEMSGAPRPVVAMSSHSQMFTKNAGSFGYTNSTGNLVQLAASAQFAYYPQNKDIFDVLATGRDRLVLLYDTKNQIGWYVPQASVVLNMAHSAISMCDYQLYNGKNEVLKETSPVFSTVSSDGWAAANRAIKQSLRFKVRKHYCPETGPVEEDFSDLIRKIWMNLDNIGDTLASKEMEFRKASTFAPHYIHGVEYKYAANSEHSSRMQIKEAKVDQPWAHLTSLEPTVIFSKNIEPAIAPDLSNLCKTWAKVPAFRNYLVLMGTAARFFLQEQVAGIAEGVNWDFEGPLIQSHGPGSNNPVCHVQKLRSTDNPGPNEPILSAVTAYRDCCLVFGNDSEMPCLEGFSELSTSSTNSSMSRFLGPGDRATISTEDSSGSELSSNTDQTSDPGVLPFESPVLAIEPPPPNSSKQQPETSAIIRLAEEVQSSEIQKSNRSAKDVEINKVPQRENTWAKVKSKVSLRSFDTNGQSNHTHSVILREASTETVPKKLNLERRANGAGGDDSNRREGKGRKAISSPGK